MPDARPVGVFDSGVGGVSVLREIHALLPGEDLLYVADSGYAPYGEKSPAFITARSQAIIGHLIEQGAKAIVIACNTATAAAARTVRARWPDLPIIGMEPAVKPAAAATRHGVVGVLATTGTLHSAQFAALLDHFGRDVHVVTRPGVGLVECVEQGALDAPATRQLLASHLAPLLEAGADVVVLGCTHYVFLRAQVEALVGPDVRVIDTGRAVAEQLRRRLTEADRLGAGAAPGRLRFWASGDLASVGRTLHALSPQDAGEVSALPV
ncbi:MAG: glutamate racemase [Rhodocyclaceae bacterium]